MQLAQRVLGVVPILYTSDLIKIPIPKFPNDRQKVISEVFYNSKVKSEGLTFRNYLEKEKKRNEKIGIFQLNNEAHSLRNTLENLVDQIINEKPVKISFLY